MNKIVTAILIIGVSVVVVLFGIKYNQEKDQTNFVATGEAVEQEAQQERQVDTYVEQEDGEISSVEDIVNQINKLTDLKNSLEDEGEESEKKEDSEIEKQTTSGGATSVNVPLSNDTGSGYIGPVGCGSYLSYENFAIPETLGVLNATYEILFNEEINENGLFNLVALTEFEFDQVTLENGVAKLYLTGNDLPGHCADHLFRAQVNYAAFQYPTVESLEVYKNGEAFDWCDYENANPEESGCDTTPKLWISINPNL